MTINPFDESVYETIRAGTQRSAGVVVPILLDLFGPESVLDVGCGEGWWAREFAQRGCSVTAVDEYVREQHESHGVRFEPADLRTTFHSPREFDLSICLEVAEHLPESSARGLISSLCESAPLVVFSAAVPGQGGHGHVNEQWPPYWEELFERNGYSVSEALRWMLWEDPRIDSWYRQNMLVAARDPDRWPAIFRNSGSVRRVVHPELHTWHASRLSELSVRMTPKRGRGLLRVRYAIWRLTGIFAIRIPR